MRRRRMIWTATAPLLLLGAAAAGPATAAPAAIRARIVVLGIPDLRWSDIDRGNTPAIRAFADRAAIGLLVVKATGSRTSPLAGWLTLSAGNRAAAPAAVGSLPLTAQLTAARRRNAELSFGAVPGVLATALRSHGRQIAAAGDGGAALAATTADGRTDPQPDVTLVGDDRLVAAQPGPDRRAAARALDRDLAPYLNRAGTRTSVLLLGVSDATTGGPHLHVAMAAGAGFSPGLLRSTSTARAPFVELIDVAPTVLALLRVPTPKAMVGTPWQVVPRSVSTPTTLSGFADIHRRALAGMRWAGPFSTALVWFILLLVSAAVAMLRAPRWRTALVVAAFTAAGLPLASYLAQLVPWWQPSRAPLLAVPAAALAALVFAAVVISRRVGPATGVLLLTGTTGGVLLLDLVSGSHLQQSAVLGDSPLLAGRFAGAGNICAALLGTAALLSAGVLAAATSRRWLVLTGTVTIGVVTLVVDGAPRLGDDAGGLLSLAPAFAVAVVLFAGGRLFSRWTLGLAAAALLPLIAVAGYDYAQPAARRSHLGRFLGGLLDGGTAGAEVHRRLAAALGSLWHSPFVLLLPAAAYLVWGGSAVLARARRRLPSLGAALIAVAVFAVIGGVVNDSGVAVPGAALSLVLPLVIALGCSDDREGEQPDPEQPGGAEPAARSAAAQRRK